MARITNHLSRVPGRRVFSHATTTKAIRSRIDRHLEQLRVDIPDRLQNLGIVAKEYPDEETGKSTCQHHFNGEKRSWLGEFLWR